MSATEKNKKFNVNENGITTAENYLVLCERVGNDRNGNPKYNITIFDKKSGRNVGYILREKIGYRFLKSNKFSLTSYNIKEVIENVINKID